MRISSLILPAINGVLWGGLIWAGSQAMNSVRSQHVPGYPNSGQIEYYVVAPIVMLCVAVLPAIIVSQTKWATFGNVWATLTLTLLVPYGCFYTGGM